MSLGEILQEELLNSTSRFLHFNEFLYTFQIFYSGQCIPAWYNILAERISHPTLKAIIKYKNHPGIVAINNLKKNFNFYFSVVSEEEFLKEIKILNPRKSTQSTDIPIKLLKKNADIFANLCGFFNQSIENFGFPSILKNENITPVFKKGYRGSKENYHPVSILPVISKIFEKLLCQYQCGLRKGCLLAMLEKWKNAVDKGKIFGALLTDLSKAFDIYLMTC